MNRSDLRMVIGVVLAVAVPALVLELTVGADRRAADMTAAPFAWRRILLVHLAAAVPLGLIVAAWVRWRPSLGTWAVAGVLLAGIGSVASAWMGDAVARSDVGAVQLLLLRSLLAFVLVLPWCIAARAPSSPLRLPTPAMGGESEGSELVGNAILFAVGGGLAVIPCGMYAEAVIAAQTQEAAGLLAQGRLARAERIVTGLCELGSRKPVGSKSPAETRKMLEDVLKRLRWRVDGPLRTSASSGSGIDRAVMLVQLERLDEAADLLRPLVPGDDTATSMLAALYGNQQRWAESDALHAAILAKMLPLAGTDDAAGTACRDALDGLADNAARDHRPADAEAALNRGLQELPADAAHYHLLLGRHYHAAGRNGLALDHLWTAAQLDPTSLGKPADDLITQIRTSTPGCLTTGR